MANQTDITPDLCRQLLHYDPETGEFTFRERIPEHFNGGRYRQTLSCRAWNARYAGRSAGHPPLRGYVRITLFKRFYAAHRLAWLYVHGVWPNQIDHINGNRSDNRLSNLRDVDVSTNGRNKARARTNTSGFGGVAWHKIKQRWGAHVYTDGALKSLGYYLNKEDAIAARRQFNRLHGFTERHGA